MILPEKIQGESDPDKEINRMLNYRSRPLMEQSSPIHQPAVMRELFIWPGQDAGRTLEIDRAGDRLALLNWASQVINSASLDPTTLYQTIQQTIAWILPVDVCTLNLLDESKQFVSEISFSGGKLVQPVCQYPLSGTFIEYLLERKGALDIAEFYRRGPAAFCFPHFYRQENFHSGLAVPLVKGAAPLGVLTIQTYQTHAYSDFDMLFLEAFAAHVSIALENANLHERVQKAVITAERQRLARDLHDTVTQLIYSMTLLSSGWKSMAENHRLKDPADSFKQLEDIGLRALKEMRLLIHQLRPPVLEEEGLVKALQKRLETVERRVNVDTRLLLDGNFPSLPRPIEQELYNIAQEALNNALRHANPSTITLRLRAEHNQVTLSVIDDGNGFEPDHFSAGIGFVSMHERAEAIGAQIRILSKPQEGTTISVSIPIKEEKEA